MDARTVGVLGGGQLGRMLLEAANRLNIKVVVLDVEGAPAKQISAVHPHVSGSFAKSDDVRRLAEECDVITAEIEHVDTTVLEATSNERKGMTIQPSWKTIRVIQDKYAQKDHLMEQDIATAGSKRITESTVAALEQVGAELGFPFMLKSRTQAYDGRGNFLVTSSNNVPAALEKLKDRPLYAEKWINFKMELAVMVVKTYQDASVDMWSRFTQAFPVVETIHEDNICKLVYAPARGVPNDICGAAQELARRAVSSFWGKGVFGVEMFWLQDGSLLVNEIAPRPHNSGHYTIEACQMSQYEAHLRAILDLPMPDTSTELITHDTTAIMLNILGGAQPDSHLTVAKEALTISAARIHLYGKGDARPGRKMGHITVTASSMKKAEKRIKPLVALFDQIHEDRKGSQTQGKPKAVAKPTQESSCPSTGALVAITMGSDSDLPVLKPGISLLEELGVPCEVTITSAHRTPGRMLQFAQQAASRGIKVIIAAAGGAAHLPGMIASSTPLPVIGVPVKASVLDGMDSLLSIVQMPRGVPVATVAINNSINAALLAARILGTANALIRSRIDKYASDMEQGVLEKADRLEHRGWKAYGSEM